jgi:TRAP-type C4-dicarboxylate transport system permease small subunit
VRRVLDIVAALLIVGGIFGLVKGGITYTSDHHDADFGAFKMSFDEKEHIPIAPVAGGLMVVGGVLILARRKLGRVS